MRLTATMNVPLAIPLATITLLPQRLGVEVGVVGLGADRRRVDEDLRARQRVGPRELREPLVPAGREAEARVGQLDHRVAVAPRGPGRKYLSS